MMKYNNIIARDNIEDPLYLYMKYDTYDDAARIKEVKLNRKIKLQKREERKELANTIEALLDADPILQEKERVKLSR